MTKKCYHVGLTVPSEDFESWNQIVMLCGKSVHKDEDTWDPPKYFLKQMDSPEEMRRCPECLNHPDYPFLVLGELP